MRTADEKKEAKRRDERQQHCCDDKMKNGDWMEDRWWKEQGRQRLWEKRGEKNGREEEKYRRRANGIGEREGGGERRNERKMLETEIRATATC